MDDCKIVALYWLRDIQAIEQTASKYGKYCYVIAHNILLDNLDAQECVNDTYLAAWNAIPPHRPSVLSTFLGKLTRRIAIDRRRSIHAQKRGGDAVLIAMEELGECVSGSSDPELELHRKQTLSAIRKFLEKLPVTERRVFLQRYWYMESVDAIAHRYGFSKSKVTSLLYRIRKQLREYLEKETSA